MIQIHILEDNKRPLPVDFQHGSRGRGQRCGREKQQTNRLHAASVESSGTGSRDGGVICLPGRDQAL
jgi:hypothetical protein